MKYAVRGGIAAFLVLISVQLGGCPAGGEPTEFLPGSTGDATVLSDEPLVRVLSPAQDLSISGGTQVEVNWQAFARTRTSVLNVVVDPDQDPDNGNEIDAYINLPLTQTSAIVDTTRLVQGTYRVGVVLTDVGQIVTFGYSPGTITIDQRPQLFFTQTAAAGLYSARQNVAFDRTNRVNPTFDVAWELSDPDSTNIVTIYLDPDESPNGNEIPLYRSASQTGDRFTFSLPTGVFPAGTYRILAVVTDGTNAFPVYAPGSIRLRARLAGFLDLREMDRGNLAAIDGAIFEGFNPRDNAGSFVTSMGDLDGDGFSEFLILSQFGKPRYGINLQRTGVGEAYMIYGRRQRFRGVNNLNSTATLFRGEIFEGPAEQGDPIRPSRGISSFATLSDWDGDGVREFAFGIPFTDSRGVAALDNDGAFRTGGVVIAAGSSLRPDLNFPGGHVYELALFGQIPYRPHVDPVCAETFFGPNSPNRGGGGITQMYRHIADADLTDPAAQLGCRIHTHDMGDQCGENISAYPSDAILISVPNRDPVVNTRVGRSIAGAGVVSLYFGNYIWNKGNGALPHDGPYRYILDDMRLFPAPPRATLYMGSMSYYVSGDATPCARVFSGDIPIPSRTARFYGGFEGASVSNSATLGDFSVDGLFDFAIGSPLSNLARGSCFLIFGRLPALMIDSELSLEEIGLPMNSADPARNRVFEGVRVIGEPGERLGQEQSPGGDFDADGIDDVCIGSPLLSNRQGGAAVFYGSREVGNLTEEEIPFQELASRSLGVILVGETEGDLAGARVASAGDVDGDGNDDVLIAAPNRSVRLDADNDGIVEIDRTECGVVYLIYGAPELRRARSQLDDGTFTEPGRLLLRDVGTINLPGAVFIGRNSGDHLGAGLGEMGDRSHGIATGGDIDGDGRSEVLIGSVSADPRDRISAGETYLIYGTGD